MIRDQQIIREILSLLPKKLQIRFQLVCKKWGNLIKEGWSNSSTPRPIDSGLLLLRLDDNDKLIKEPSFYRLDSKGSLTLEQDQHSLIGPSSQQCGIRTIGSCNGVIFYSMKSTTDHEDHQHEEKYTFHLFNPVTKQVSNLPIPDEDELLGSNPLPIALGFAPNLEYPNGYKFIIVHGKSWEQLTPSSISIFHSQTGKWTTKFYHRLTFCNFSSGKYFNRSSVYANGCLYWDGDPYMVTFCLQCEDFRPLFPPFTCTLWPGLLWESEGRLNYCQMKEGRELCIWVLITEGLCPLRKRWEQIFSVSVDTLNSLVPGFCMDPFCFTAKVAAFDEHLQIVYFRSHKGELFSYDISEKTLTRVLINNNTTVSDFKSVLPFTYRTFEYFPGHVIIPDNGSGRKRGRRERVPSLPLRRSERIKHRTESERDSCVPNSAGCSTSNV